jgi:hypothetical protein
VLSHPLSVIALVGRYPANKLIDHRPLSKRLATLDENDLRPLISIVELVRLSAGYARLRGRLPMCYAPVCHWPSIILLQQIARSTCMP